MSPKKNDVCKSKKFSKLSPPRGLEGKNNTSLTFLAYFPKNTQIEGKLPHRFAKILVSANNLRINYLGCKVCPLGIIY